MIIFMLNGMRTTLIIDDEVFKNAKKEAAVRGKTVGELVTQALREVLAERQAPKQPPFSMPVFGQAGRGPGHSPKELAALRDEGR